MHGQPSHQHDYDTKTNNYEPYHRTYGNAHGNGQGNGHHKHHNAYGSGFHKGQGYRGKKGFKEAKGHWKNAHGSFEKTDKDVSILCSLLNYLTI